MSSLILQPYSRLDTKTPTLSQTGYFHAETFITIMDSPTEHTLYNPGWKDPCCRLHYLYTGHFHGELYPILKQNCLISIPYSQTKLPKNHTLHSRHIPT